MNSIRPFFITSNHIQITKFDSNLSVDSFNTKIMMEINPILLRTMRTLRSRR